MSKGKMNAEYCIGTRSSVVNSDKYYTKLGEVIRDNNNNTIEYVCSICFQSHKSVAELRKHFEHNHDDNEANQLEDILELSGPIDAECSYMELHASSERLDDIKVEEDYISDGNEAITLEIVVDGESCTEKAKDLDENNIEMEIRCECCPNETYACVGLLNEHLFLTQNVDAHPCDKCGGLFMSKIGLLQHQKVHEEETILECPHCTTFFGDSTELDAHLANIFDESELHVEPAPVDSDGNFTENEIVDKTQDGSKFKCDFCPKDFKRMINLTRHLNRFHRNKFKQKQQGKENPKINSKTKTINCIICSKIFATKFKLTQHMRTLHHKVHLLCEICKKVFKTKENLAQHQRSHTGERPYKCKICHKRFNHSSYINIHMRTHTKEKPYLCNQCDAGFISKSKLTAHIKNHQNIRPHACDLCEKTFRTPADLRDHHRSEHTSDRPFECSICDATFAKQKLLLQHNYLHSESKRFQCRYCPKAFSQSAGRHGHEKRNHLVD